MKGPAVTKGKAIKLLKKQFSRKHVKASLVKEFNLFIRQRDKNICFTCGSTKQPTCGHLITCANESTQFDELNCHCQCAGCNMVHEWHPETYTLKFIQIYGQDRYENLVMKSKQKSGLKTAELNVLLNHYRELNKQLTPRQSQNL